MTRIQLFRSLLSEGCMTTDELAAASGLSASHARIIISQMAHRGQAVVVDRIKNPETKRWMALYGAPGTASRFRRPPPPSDPLALAFNEWLKAA